MAPFSFPYETSVETLNFGDTELSVERLTSLDATIDSFFKEYERTGRTELFEGLCPYFGVPWQAGKTLAALLSREGTRWSGEEVLELLSNRLEAKDGWAFKIPDDLAVPGRLIKSIIGFEIPVASRSGKFKLSQNKTVSDYEGVLAGLASRQDESSRGVLDWMKRLAKRVQGRD